MGLLWRLQKSGVVFPEMAYHLEIGTIHLAHIHKRGHRSVSFLSCYQIVERFGHNKSLRNFKLIVFMSSGFAGGTKKKLVDLVVIVWN
jgi:hypothetical protein